MSVEGRVKKANDLFKNGYDLYVIFDSSHESLFYYEGNIATFSTDIEAYTWGVALKGRGNYDITELKEIPKGTDIILMDGIYISSGTNTRRKRRK